MTEQELKEQLEAAERGPREVARAVEGLDEAMLQLQPGPDKWSIQEVLGHLADCEIVYGYRIRQVIADRQPVFAPIDQNEWARHLGYTAASPTELLALYTANRRGNLRLLQSVTAEQLSRSAFHPELQRQMTLAECIERMTSHDGNHLAQIERLKEEASSSG